MKSTNNQSHSIQIVSPFAHLSGHYWPYTLDMIRALSYEDINIQLHASQQPLYSKEIQKSHISWKACASWVSRILTKTYRDQHWGGLLDRILRNIEFYRCLHSALQTNRRSDLNTHIYCVESCHRILINAVLKNRDQTFSSLCVGSPPQSLSHTRIEAYKAAFRTNRLTFIVETEAVRDAWKPYAGQNVIYIPAGIPTNEYTTITQEQARKHLGLPQNGFICLFFGTHRIDKDYVTAIKAAKLSKSQPYLLFVGPLISSNDPAKLLRELNYPKGISWDGYYPDENVGTLFDACDAIILPYASEYTKGSAVLLQACQYMKPVIATNTGHLAEFIQKHQTGLLFNSGDIQNLADCYDQLATLNQEIAINMKKTILKTREFYSWKRLIESYLTIFMLRNVIADKSVV